MKSSVLRLMGRSNANGLMKNAYNDTIKIILKETDKLSKANELNDKQAMHMRLLVEETICMLPEILQYGDGTFWIDNFYQKYEIHLRVRPNDVDSKVNGVVRSSDPFLKKGILRRICAAFDRAVNEGRDKKGTMDNWSLLSYIDSVKQSGKNKNLDAWDELEKSIIANLADDVTVSTVDDEIEVVVIKEF
ncbi:hypothetical protein [Ruminococcus sp.]|uniref:hypothetical protein n=1 Tax=Ruminococcus sp. TaxID=41978 RepID=UPI0025F33CE6|nr:hypothetical protein [Ruminococcus sp.]MBQ8967445.1 hypothetical protein [Ruminococcus sp.]